MKVVVLFSSGKDSTYAAWWAVQQGWDVECLLTALPKEESMMFHHPNAEWAALSAEAMGLKHRTFETGEGELEELRALEGALAQFKGKIDGVVSGALASDYQKNRIDRICERLGFRSFAPLWHKDQLRLLKEMVEQGFGILVVGCFAEGLDESWLGRKIDGKAIDELAALQRKHGVSPAGEGGEWESFAVDSPLHKKRIEIEDSERRWERNSGILEIKRARLLGKHPR